MKKTPVKQILSALAIVATMASASAAPLETVARNPAATFTTTYPAHEAFHHVVGEKAYIGYFLPKPSVCSVWVLSKPVDESPADKATQQQVEFDLAASQTMTFPVNSRGSRLSLTCAADAKSLAVSQTWVPQVKASAAE